MAMQFARKGFTSYSKAINGRRSASNVPLTEPFPGVPELKNDAPSTAKLTVSSLPSGLKVASYFTHEPIASVGLFVNAGSRYENADNTGSASFLKHMSFKSNFNRSQLRFNRELELAGATYDACVGRDSLVFHAEVGVERAPNVVEILAGVTVPRLPEYEIRDERATVSAQTEKSISNIQNYVLELLHQEAYRNAGLGQPTYVPSYQVENLDETVLKQYVDTFYTADRMTLVSVGGVDHKDLVMYAEAWLSQVKKGSSVSAPASPYVGGDLRVPAASKSHIAVGFEGLGLNANVKELAAIGILQHILGSGKALKVGPQYVKGNASKLGKTVDANAFLTSASAFSFNYSDSGLFGVYAESQRGSVQQTIQAIAKDVKSLNSVTSDDVERGKAGLAADILFGTTSKSSVLQFIGRQVAAGANALSPVDFVSALQTVTVADVKKVAQKVISSKPTLTILGDVTKAPTTQQITALVQ